jgi:excisionase family DNA binding protein
MQDVQPEPSNTSPEPWLTKAEALQLLNVSERSLDRLVTAGKVEKRTRPAAGRMPEPIFNRADVERITAIPAHPMPDTGTQLERAPQAFPSPAMLAQLADFASATRLLAPPPAAIATAWLTLDEASTYTGLSAFLLRKLIRAGRLLALRDRKLWKIHRSDLDNIRAAPEGKSATGGR